MEQKRQFCAWCSLMIFPYESRIKDKELDYHPTCFDKQVKKEKGELHSYSHKEVR